ncbi:L-lysine 2,3-aminomutase [Methylomarinovum caldicuralii]|uniref:L-lysine 2,3-aminomutase n=1 Tax=Methylomarinovum caldicuralii TaxID=438856 RepID=A0AAU9BQ23_9GAMM|nr:EF-P beta-lysylation protein EpmB [Methylomarinovum caldicuralii]BCX80501.1 L-lysine 2,3-aminomutase [Methylomarinovum caldicuralii]
MASIITQPSPLPAWRRELAEGFKRPEELLAFLGLPASGWDAAAQRDFPLRVPRAFARRMRRGDPDDPLLRQVLPLAAENAVAPGFVSDPVGDGRARAAPGLLHKYHGRALLVTTGACAIHCRYCFRRHFPYSRAQLTPARLRPALDYLRRHEEISEIILSGGDPLMLADARLSGLIRALEDIPQLRRLRLHTRLPVVLPSRITEALTERLAASRLQCVIVVHVNHANEIDADVAAAVTRLRQAGITVLNQGTLLAGVNDTLGALVALQEQCFATGILPYYLHLLDRTRGTDHFEVEALRARELYEALRRRLPGYLTPRLARESPGAPYKIWF